MFEGYEALQKVRKKALALTRFNSWTVVDGGKPAEEVALALRNGIF
jgi:hypothetical protein